MTGEDLDQGRCGLPLIDPSQPGPSFLAGFPPGLGASRRKGSLGLIGGLLEQQTRASGQDIGFRFEESSQLFEISAPRIRTF
jgi:hypothetical protein